MASMSHEFRNSAYTVAVTSWSLKMMSRCLRISLSFEDLVTMMLESAKLHRGVIPLSYDSFKLEDVWLDALGKVALTQVRINRRGESTVVVADRHLCTRVFINIFSNIKALYSFRKVWLEAENLNDEVYIFIRDSKTRSVRGISLRF